jgi:hypothetical protein
MGRHARALPRQDLHEFLRSLSSSASLFSTLAKKARVIQLAYRFYKRSSLNRRRSLANLIPNRSYSEKLNGSSNEMDDVRGFDKVILGNTLLRNIEKDKQNKKIIGAPQRLTGVRETSDSFSRVDAWRLGEAARLGRV